MLSRLSVILAGALVFFAVPTASDACTRQVSKAAVQKVVPASRIDQKLIDRSVLAEVNFHRCRAGLPKITSAGKSLANEALKHSAWMARNQTLSHRSNVKGRASLMQRIKASGVRFRTGSENVGMVHRYQIDNRRFKVVDSSQCRFQTQKGQPLPAHSYATLARHIVDLWMNSPGHRRNILDRNVKKVSTAVAFDPKARYCGRFWLTQNFVG